MRSDITAVIMAGGRSQRFGSNKALARIGENRVIEKVAGVLKDIFEETLVLAKDKTALAFLQKPWIHILGDRFENFHPLNGLASALTYARTDRVFVCGCDMPFINPELIHLVCSKSQEADAVVPIWQGEIQPLVGVYSKACLTKIFDLSLFNDPRKGFQYLLSKVNTKTVGEKELGLNSDAGLSFFDIDTPEQLQQARGFAEAAHAR